MPSIFESLVKAAHTAGEYARSASAAAWKTWEAVEPSVTATLNAARTLTDKDARKQAMDQLDAIVQRAKEQGSAYLGELQTAVNGMREAANGVPPQIAIKLATFASVQEAAAAKGALNLAEMQICVKAVEELRAAVDVNPTGDYTKQGEELDKLIVAASQAVDKLSADEGSVRGLLADAATLVTDIRSANTKCIAADVKYKERVKDAASVDVDSTAKIDTIAGTLTEAQASFDKGDFGGAAVAIHNWIHEAQLLLAERNAKRLELVKKFNEPDSVEGVFSTLYARAEKFDLVGEKGDAKLNELAGSILTATRQKPCDVKEASALLDHFRERLGVLEANRSSQS